MNPTHLLEKVDAAFRPFAPIDTKELFSGRVEQMTDLVDALKAPGRHAVLFGDRGVGKTSLANIVAALCAQVFGIRVFTYRCSDGDDFSTIFTHFLRETGKDKAVTSRTTTYKSKKGAKVSIGVAEAGVGADRQTEETQQDIFSYFLVPSLVEKLLADERCLLVVDEFDRVGDAKTRTSVADTVKKLSDGALEAKLLVVGVAETVDELIGEHASIERCLAQVRLPRMADHELEGIVKIGERVLDLRFESGVAKEIIGLSDGLPYYTHLLCYGAVRGLALAANRENPDTDLAGAPVGKRELALGLEYAVRNADQSLRAAYEKATVAAKGSLRFRDVLWAAAAANGPVVRTAAIQKNLEKIEGEEVKVQQFVYHLGLLCDAKKAAPLKKVSKGLYKFRNPLLRGFTRIARRNSRPSNSSP